MKKPREKIVSLKLAANAVIKVMEGGQLILPDGSKAGLITGVMVKEKSKTLTHLIVGNLYVPWHAIYWDTCRHAAVYYTLQRS